MFWLTSPLFGQTPAAPQAPAIDPAILQQLGETGGVPTIPWQAMSVELVLFAAALIALALDAAKHQRKGMSFTLLLVTVTLAVLGIVFSSPERSFIAMAGAVGVLGIVQFVLAMTLPQRPRLMVSLISWLGAAVGLAMTVNLWINDPKSLSVLDPASGKVGSELIDVAGYLNNLLVVDGASLAARGILCVILLLAIPMSYEYMESRQIHRGEYYPLLLLSAVGMTIMASSDNLLMVFVGVEIFSLALYVLTAFAKRDMNSQEAAIKYFILGSTASAVMLYGMALLYGLAGTTQISALGAKLVPFSTPNGALIGALVLTLVGLAFKAGLVPFHFWMPDVYQGAPTPVTAFMAAGTKVAAFVAFMRVFAVGLGHLQWTWMPIVVVLGSLTMVIGALGAVTTKDVKRILGWSAITHAGYLTLAIMGTDLNGNGGRGAVAGLLIYLLAYGLAVLGAFGCVSFVERRLMSAPQLADLSGIGRRNAGVGVMLSICLFSLAGIPGTVGFIGKLSVFMPAFQAGQYLPVGIALTASVIASIFYLGIIAKLWMGEETAKTAELPDLAMAPGTMLGTGMSTMLVVVLGILPAILILLGNQAASILGG